MNYLKIKKELLDSANKIVSKVPTATLVGVAGFEPTTPCPPDKCATRLRYTPNRNIIPYFQKNCKGAYNNNLLT